MKQVIGIIIGLLILAGSLLVKVHLQSRELVSNNHTLNEELMRANLELGRARTQFGNANSYINELDNKLQKEIKERKAAITRIGQLEAILLAHNSGDIETNIELQPEDSIPIENGGLV